MRFTSSCWPKFTDCELILMDILNNLNEHLARQQVVHECEQLTTNAEFAAGER